MDKLHLFSLLTQCIALIFGAYSYFSNKNKFTLLLFLYLLITMLVELSGAYMISVKTKSFALSFFYTMIAFSVVFMMYKGVLNLRRNTKIIYVLHLFFLVFLGITFFRNELLNYAIIIGSFNTSIYLFLYLSQLMFSDKIIEYKKTLPFWVTIGFFTFYLPSIPFFIMFDSMRDRSLFFVLNILIIIMNLIIICGVLWSKKEVKY